MPVEGWHERHETCLFGTYEPADEEGFVVASCKNPEVGASYSEHFCARDCPKYQARVGRIAQGRIPACTVRELAGAAGRKNRT